MLDPSSSEEEGDELLKESPAPQSLGGAQPSADRGSAEAHGGGRLQPRGRGSAGGRPSSPSPSVGSDKEKEDLEKLQREEEEKKKRLQLYVFVMRCIAYPFNAKQPTDMARRQQKVQPHNCCAFTPTPRCYGRVDWCPPPHTHTQENTHSDKNPKDHEFRCRKWSLQPVSLRHYRWLHKHSCWCLSAMSCSTGRIQVEISGSGHYIRFNMAATAN